MASENLLIAAGLLLILAGIFGGGFEVQKIKIPTLGNLLRVISCGVGIGLILLSISMQTGLHDKTTITPAAAALHDKEQPSASIQFVIFDELTQQGIASGQSEQALIRINGKSIGTLTVNEQFPNSEVVVTVPNEGQHSFAIEATARFRINKDLIEVNCYGVGMINVKARDRFLFEVRYDENGPCLAWLEER
jgi:hypothetical protein